MKKITLWHITGILAAAVLIALSIIFISNRAWLRTDSRGINPETGQRYASPFWERKAEPELSLVLQAAADWPVHGIDVSKWQGQINWDVTVSRGIIFAIIRTSYTSGGSHYEDSWWSYNVAEAKRVGIYCGVYHYIVPSGSSVAIQAKYFSDRINQADCDLPPVMDVEDRGGLTPKALADWLKNFADIIETETGKKPIIYTRATFWNDYVEARPYWRDYKLWIARYDSTLSAPWPPYSPRDWITWTFWQWSAGGNGLGSYYGAQSSDIDLDRYNRSLDDFLVEFNLVEPPKYEDIVISPGTYDIVIDGENIVFKRRHELMLPLLIISEGE